MMRYLITRLLPFVAITTLAASSVADTETDLRHIRSSLCRYWQKARFEYGREADSARSALSTELRKARTVWLRNRKDPVANFHVAYLIHAGADKKLLPEWSPTSPDLDLVPPGKSVEYDVLRWLVRDTLDETAQTAAKGEALLKRSPNDLVLVMSLTILTTWGGKTDHQRAVELTDLWLKLDPKAFQPYVYRGLAYEKLDNGKGGPLALRAIAGYETFVRLAPKLASFRPGAEASLKELRKLVEKRR